MSEHELTWAPAWRISELIEAREVSPVEVLEQFLGLGPLHGIPTAVKGHIDIAGVAETMPFGMGIARR